MAYSTGHHQLFCTIIAVISPVVSVHLTKTGVFNSGSVEFDDLVKMPATLTIPLYDCSSSYRPKPDVPNAYQVYHNYQWHVHFCQEGLLWNETLCRCHYPHGETPSKQCNDFRAASTEPSGKYKQIVNGQWIIRHCSHASGGLVWNQEVCQCVWSTDSKTPLTGHYGGSCDVMLNMTFEDGIVDYGKNSFVEIRKKDHIKTLALNKEELLGGSKAAYFNDSALKIWYFAGNEMGTSLRVNFRFKMTSVRAHGDKYQMFISNGCRGSTVGYTTPSLAIGYRTADQTFVLAFETSSARKAVVCSSQSDPYNWQVVSLVYNDGSLILSVNDRLCIVSLEFSGPIQETHCPLTVGADPLLEGSMLKGYLDNLLIERYCRTTDEDRAFVAANGKGPIPQTFSATQFNHMKQRKTDIFDVEVLHDEMKEAQQSSIVSTKYMAKFSNMKNKQRKNTDETISHIVKKPYGYTHSPKLSPEVRSYTNRLNNMVASGQFTHYGPKVRSQRSQFTVYERNTGRANEKVITDNNSSKEGRVTNRKEYSDRVVIKSNRLTNLNSNGISQQEMYSSKIKGEREVDSVKLKKKKTNDRKDNLENPTDSSRSTHLSFYLGDSKQLDSEDTHNEKNTIQNIYYMGKNEEKDDDDDDRVLKTSRKYDNNLEKYHKNSHTLNKLHDSDEQTYIAVYQANINTNDRNNNLYTESKNRKNRYNYFETESRGKSTRDVDISTESKDRNASETYLSAETNKGSNIATEFKDANSRNHYLTAELYNKRTNDNIAKIESRSRNIKHYIREMKSRDNNTRGYDAASETRLRSHILNGVGDSTHGSAISMDDVVGRDMHSRKAVVREQYQDPKGNTFGNPSNGRSDNVDRYDNTHHGLKFNENKGLILQNKYESATDVDDTRNDRHRTIGTRKANKNVSHHGTQDKKYSHRYEDGDVNGLRNTIRHGDGIQFLNNADYNGKMTNTRLTGHEDNSDVEHNSSSVTSSDENVDINALLFENNKPDIRGNDRVGPRWYDVGVSSRRVIPPHLIGVDLSHGSAFIIDRRHRNNIHSLGPKQNFIKGRRRSGSKKNNWYDKSDASTNVEAGIVNKTAKRLSRNPGRL